MRCLKCGVAFSESDIFIILEDGDEPICDSCEFRGDFYSIAHGGTDFVVQAEDSEDAIRRWKEFVVRMEIVSEDFSSITIETKKIEHAVLFS